MRAGHEGDSSLPWCGPQPRDAGRAWAHRAAAGGRNEGWRRTPLPGGRKRRCEAEVLERRPAPATSPLLPRAGAAREVEAGDDGPVASGRPRERAGPRHRVGKGEDCAAALSLSSPPAATAGGGDARASPPLPLSLSLFQSTHDQGHRLLAADRHGRRNLLVPPNREGAHRVAGLAEDGLLARQLLENL